MGAWGTGVFDDDTAYDVVEDLNAAEDPRAFLARAFAVSANLNDDVLKHDDCHAITVSAAYVDILVNGTQYRIDAMEETLAPFLEKNRNLDVTDLRGAAVASVQRVLDGSELDAVWRGNTMIYPLWRQVLTGLIARLSTHS